MQAASSHQQTLQAKHYLVTGGSSGIGRAIAIALAEAGAHLQLLGRNQERLESVASQARQCGAASVQCHQLNLCDDAALLAYAKQVDSCHGLVHSAGMVQLASVADTSLDSLDAQYALNTRAPVLLTRALLPRLRASGGDVVFINSTAGLRTNPNWGSYAMSKAALRVFADTLRMEEPELRVLSVYPSRTASPMQAQVYAMEGRSTAYQPETLLQPKHIAAQVVQALTLPARAMVYDLAIR